MDWSGPKRTAHSNAGRERINLMEVAEDFLGGVEFASDVRGETSRREHSCRLATQNVTRPVNKRAFVGTNWSGELITSAPTIGEIELGRKCAGHAHVDLLKRPA